MNETISAANAGTITIGEDLTVNRLGLGTNRITDTDQARALLKRAVELGVNFIDTSDVYADSASETTIGKTLAPYPTGLVIATKGSMLASMTSDIDASPEHLKAAIDASLRRLKLKRIDLYQLHRVDPKVSLEKTVNFLKQARDEGKIRHIGLSKVTIDQLELARKIVPIASVQNLYNVLEREDDKMVDYCEKNNIVYIPYRPLGGIGSPVHTRTLKSLATKYHITMIQLGLAWLLQRSPAILPIPGTLSIEHLEANLAAAKVKLSSADLAALN